MPGTPQRLRQLNDRTALALLLEHGELTRFRLCELSGLSRPTASQIMSRLESANLVHVVGETPAKRGPSAANYAVRDDRILAVAINIDHGVVQSTVVDAFNSPRPIAQLSLARSARERNPGADVMGAIEAACREADVDRDAVRMICIGVQGAVDSRRDELNFVEALPGWPRRGVRAELEAELGLRVTIENDVNLAAVAERRQGAGAGAESFALVWIGDGLGLAVDLGGTVLHGSSGRAGEIGYLTVPQRAASLDPDAKVLQDFVGAAGLMRIARAHGLHKRGLRTLLPLLATDPARDEIFAALAPRIAAAVTAVLAVADPERLVLGGPVGAAGGQRLAGLVQAATRRDSRWSPDIVTSAVTDYPVLVGARELLTADVREALINEVSD